MFRKIISITTIILVILAYMPSAAFAEEPAQQEPTAPAVTEETEPAPAPEPAAETEPAKDKEPAAEQTDADKPDSPAKDEITVTFRLIAKGSDWIKKGDVKVKEGSTLEEFLDEVFEDQDFEWKSKDGEIVSITCPQAGGNEAVCLKTDADTGDAWVVYINKQKKENKPLELKLDNRDAVVIAFETEGQETDLDAADGDADSDSDADVDSDADSDSDAGLDGESVPEGEVDPWAELDPELAALLMANGLLPPLTASDETVEKKSETVSQTVVSMGNQSKWDVGTEFMAIGLTRNDGFSDSYVDQYCTNLVTQLDKNKSAMLSENQASNNAKAIIALTSMGIDPTDVYGYNLLEPLSDMDYVQRQGINGIIWTLIAFDSYGYEIPENADPEKQTTREGLVGSLLSGQKADGGWAYSGAKSDVDMTGMALQALAPYYKKDGYEDVTAAVNEALEWLSNAQDANGDFGSFGNVTCESAAQVVVALCALGINPNTDPRFVKNGNSAVDSLLSFYTQGGFKHIRSESGRNTLATTQGNYALTAYLRFIGEKTSLYDMSDIESLTKTTATPGKEEDDNKDDKEKADGDTKATGKTVSLNLKLSAAAKDVIDMIKAAVSSGSEEAAKNAYSAYLKLSPAERLAVRKDDIWKEYKELVDGFGRANHFDEATGVDLTGSSAKALPWYILLVVEEEALTEDVSGKITGELGEESEVLSTYDISFVNTLTGKEWHPKKIVRVKLNVPDLKGLENAIVYHVNKDGKIEFLTSETKEDTIEFNAIEFSIYGIAGMNGTFGDLLTVVEPEPEDEGQPSALPWLLALIAALALALLIVLIVRRRRESDE